MDFSKFLLERCSVERASATSVQKFFGSLRKMAKIYSKNGKEHMANILKDELKLVPIEAYEICKEMELLISEDSAKVAVPKVKKKKSDAAGTSDMKIKVRDRRQGASSASKKPPSLKISNSLAAAKRTGCPVPELIGHPQKAEEKKSAWLSDEIIGKLDRDHDGRVSVDDLLVCINEDLSLRGNHLVSKALLLSLLRHFKDNMGQTLTFVQNLFLSIDRAKGNVLNPKTFRTMLLGAPLQISNNAYAVFWRYIAMPQLGNYTRISKTSFWFKLSIQACSFIQEANQFSSAMNMYVEQLRKPKLQVRVLHKWKSVRSDIQRAEARLVEAPNDMDVDKVEVSFLEIKQLAWMFAYNANSKLRTVLNRALDVAFDRLLRLNDAGINALGAAGRSLLVEAISDEREAKRLRAKRLAKQESLDDDLSDI